MPVWSERIIILVPHKFKIVPGHALPAQLRIYAAQEVLTPRLEMHVGPHTERHAGHFLRNVSICTRNSELIQQTV